MIVELAGGLPIAPQVTAAPPPSPAMHWPHEPTVFEPPSREELDIIVARPLFSPSRRPSVAPQAGAAPPEAPLPPLELIGVLLTETQQTALVRPLDGGDPAWVRKGDAVAGWRIDKIERRGVHLRAGDRLEVVELRGDAAAPADARSTPREARRQEEREARSVDAERAPESDEGGAEAEADQIEAAGIAADEIAVDGIADQRSE